MINVRTSMKANLFSCLEKLTGDRPYFSYPAVKQALGDSPLAAKPALLREYLSEAMERKVVHDAGRGWYSSLEAPAALDAETPAPLRETLARRFPFPPNLGELKPINDSTPSATTSARPQPTRNPGSIPVVDIIRKT